MPGSNGVRAAVQCVFLLAAKASDLKKASCSSENQKREEKKNKDEERRSELEKKHFDFSVQHPQAALAVYFRNLEDRLIAIMNAQQHQKKAAYVAARKNQALTQLEETVFRMEPILKAGEFPVLAPRSADFLRENAKPPDKRRNGSKAASSTRSKEGSRGRSQSRAKTQIAGRNRSKEGSRSQSKKSSRAASSKRGGSETKRSASRNSKRSTSRNRGASSQKFRSGSQDKKKGKGTGKGKGKGRGKGRRQQKSSV